MTESRENKVADPATLATLATNQALVANVAVVATPDGPEITNSRLLTELCETLNVSLKQIVVSVQAQQDGIWWSLSSTERERLIEYYLTAQVIRAGFRPPHFQVPTFCSECGPVWLRYPDQDCPWCENRQSGLSIPRPQKVACTDCRHYAVNPINPAGGMGQCMVNATSAERFPTFPRAPRDCSRYQSTEPRINTTSQLDGIT